MKRHPWNWAFGVAVVGVMLTALDRPASAWQDPEALADQGVQVLTRGPVNEAFAEPVVYDPKPGPVIPKEPPPPVKEMPPDQRPAGTNVQWIPGYWSWDDSRNDFIWVSGVWRDVPPGRHWVPGYWDQVQGGYQWVPGYWAPDDQNQAQYLPPPPPSQESGPVSSPPSPGATWAPGSWVWQGNQYVWSPGYWVPFQQNWLWVPSHYSWTPSGYVYNNGYWDLPFQQRGTMFAPVAFQQPLYNQPNFMYTPTVGLLGASLLSSMFVRPSYGQYYFGDYYGANNFQSGIYPWYSYHQSNYGYDPLFAHVATLNTRNNPQWLDQLHEQYRYRREHQEARPPHTFAQQQALAQRAPANNAAKVQNLVLARPLNQLASGTGSGSAATFERLNEERRREYAQRAAQLHEFRQQRVAREDQLGRQPAASAAPRTVALPRSPIVASPPRDEARRNPPPRPAVSRPEPTVQTTQPRPQPQPRFEPHPDQLPPPQFRPSFTPPAAPAGQPPRRR